MQENPNKYLSFIPGFFFGLGIFFLTVVLAYDLTIVAGTCFLLFYAFFLSLLGRLSDIYAWQSFNKYFAYGGYIGLIFAFLFFLWTKSISLPFGA